MDATEVPCPSRFSCAPATSVPASSCSKGLRSQTRTAAAGGPKSHPGLVLPRGHKKAGRTWQFWADLTNSLGGVCSLSTTVAVSPLEGEATSPTPPQRPCCRCHLVAEEGRRRFHLPPCLPACCRCTKTRKAGARPSVPRPSSSGSWSPSIHSRVLRGSQGSQGSRHGGQGNPMQGPVTTDAKMPANHVPHLEPAAGLRPAIGWRLALLDMRGPTQREIEKAWCDR